MATGNIKILKLRMKSIKSIEKITKAMKMVATSKLRGAQRTKEVGRPYYERLANLLQNVTTPESQHNTFIYLTTDRGLCGAINSAVLKQGHIFAKELLKKNKDIEIISLGDKGRDNIIRVFPKQFNKVINETRKKPISFLTASLVASEILKHNYDLCILVFNRFKSIVSYKVTEQKVPSYNILADSFTDKDIYELETDQLQLFQDLSEFYLTTTVYHGLIENASSEEAARMTAMDNATRNASEMLDKITLQYNISRQASITKELIEIISGAGALA